MGIYEKETRVLGRDIFEKTMAQKELEADGMIGRSRVMYQMLQEIRNARDSKYPTLLVGETGVGKELAARALVPKNKSLIAISGASYTDRENLLESELFGYVRGAFTDARSDTPGLVMQAHNNVLFLDELHQLSISAQSKLLRFLQEMRFRRVGDTSGKETAVNFKLIAAVQPDIRERIKDGRFLPDLLERVGALIIHVPPLRDRADDIELLVRKFQDEYNEGRAPHEQRQFRISTVNEMAKHNWPFNVRSLQNAVRRMLTNCRTDIVNPKDFRLYLDVDLTSEIAVSDVENLPLEEATKRFQMKAIVQALKDSRTRVEAAARCGLSLTSFSAPTREAANQSRFIFTTDLKKE